MIRARLQRLLRFLVLALAVWGALSLAALLYVALAPATGEQDTSLLQPSSRVTGLTAQTLVPVVPPQLPPGWEWYEITPNTPNAHPPDWLLGLPAGSSVVGEEDWVLFFLPDGSLPGPEGFRPQLQQGQRCKGMPSTGETIPVAGSPATAYRRAPRFPDESGMLCLEFLYQGRPWRFMVVGIGTQDWETAYLLTSCVVPKPYPAQKEKGEQ